MSSVLQLPKLGLTMTEGTVAQWLVPPGTPFRRGQPLYVLETEKVANEIEADDDGVLDECLVDAGATVPVGTAIARWTPASAAPARAAGKPRVRLTPVLRDINAVATAPAASRTQTGRILASPYARRLAREAGLDLAAVTTTRARITAADVRRALGH